MGRCHSAHLHILNLVAPHPITCWNWPDAVLVGERNLPEWESGSTHLPEQIKRELVDLFRSEANVRKGSCAVFPL